MMSCEQHDYIEIACLYRYPVTLTLISGDELNGIAIDTARNEEKAECIKILADNTARLVPLANIVVMKAAVNNPHFSTVTFD
jgi:Rho-binding antiterminator